MKKFNCTWFAPTYYPAVNIECDGTLNDENRGFDDAERKLINELELGGVLTFEGLVIVRFE